MIKSELVASEKKFKDSFTEKELYAGITESKYVVVYCIKNDGPYFKGIVVYAEEGVFELFYYSEIWNKKNFTPYYGDILISAVRQSVLLSEKKFKHT